jgi:serine/threonine-protein kinase RsbT
MKEKQIPINMESDVLSARSAGRDMAKKLGFASADQTRLATAISELGWNIIKYAEKGVVTVVDESDSSNMKVKVVVADNGPGIPDINKALEDGYTPRRRLSVGLPGTKQLVHEFDIISRPGHTRVTVAITRPQSTAARIAGATRRSGMRATRPGMRRI